jgi:hypothetical protein
MQADDAALTLQTSLKSDRMGGAYAAPSSGAEGCYLTLREDDFLARLTQRLSSKIQFAPHSVLGFEDGLIEQVWVHDLALLLVRQAGVLANRAALCSQMHAA